MITNIPAVRNMLRFFRKYVANIVIFSYPVIVHKKNTPRTPEFDRPYNFLKIATLLYILSPGHFLGILQNWNALQKYIIYGRAVSWTALFLGQIYIIIICIYCLMCLKKSNLVRHYSNKIYYRSLLGT